MKTLTNNYIFKALDAYPYDLEEAMEALTYALAYDEKNTMVLGLLGRINAESLYDYEKAKSYFAEALAEDINAFHIYPHYVNVLLWNEDLDEAEKLIDFALKIKGSDKAVLYVSKARLFEQKRSYQKALDFLKEAKIHTYNDSFMYTINQHKDRIKDKVPRKKKKTKKKEKKKEAKAKKNKKKK
ncbi:tetratricopeptide repeat protein [Tenacibaculum jejuense]|uniref:Uncharacterized protein n=1 Tax=Tenacibaculum jejuense TaxID=584609 RepID=A0A238U9U6_9FLAO|nr:hypothetical protein [Tenacibaculum jejuense]SNR15845.1 conserved protein of unknown function [Tenacibaculum jejuense]